MLGAASEELSPVAASLRASLTLAAGNLGFSALRIKESSGRWQRL
jgi:hypothetical protein